MSEQSIIQQTTYANRYPVSLSFLREQLLPGLIEAGVDIMLECGNLDVLQLIDEVHTMVEAGEISPEAIDEGVRRVLLLKWKYGLL